MTVSILLLATWLTSRSRINQGNAKRIYYTERSVVLAVINVWNYFL